MSKLLTAVVAIMTVTLAVDDQSLSHVLNVNNPMIKLLSSISQDTKEFYPGDDTNYDDLLKALAALQEPITVSKVKQVLKELAPKLFQRVGAAEEAFVKVRDSIVIPEAKNFVSKYFDILEEYWLVGMRVPDQLKKANRMRKLYSGLNDEAKKAVREKEKDALDAVVKALYSPSCEKLLQ